MKKCKYCQSEIEDKAKVCPHCKKNQKSPIIRMLGVILIIISIIILFSAISDLGKNTTELEKTYITMENFNQIKTGMSYEEVKNIIGSDGTIMSETEDGKIFYWYGKDNISNANFTFINNKLIGKSQLGL